LKIIDAHVHFSNIKAFKDYAEQTSMVDYSERGFKNESTAHDVVKSVCMGLVETTPGGFPDNNAGMPMMADLCDNLPSGMSLCLGINPHTLDNRSLSATEDVIRNNKNIVGMKIYAGYYHIDITDLVYNPLYDLAEKHDLTVAIHSGETFSGRGLLKYSHPLRIDDLAVTRPDLRIVACHMGAPWVFDACEVAAKNPNVYIDLSGLLVGNAEFIRTQTAEPLLVDRYKQALVFMQRYDKVLYGTDWPLVPMGAYIEFCKELIPVEYHEDVFSNNAMRVYNLSNISG